MVHATGPHPILPSANSPQPQTASRERREEMEGGDGEPRSTQSAALPGPKSQEKCHDCTDDMCCTT
eukprot:11695566-Alexandrium_andersonii.AAC.1